MGLNRPDGIPLRLVPIELRSFGVASLVLTLGVLVSRLPFRSEYLFAWDSANYALALDYYNVAFHQPQPPGYPVYVAAAWMLHQLGVDANQADVMLSVLASVAAAVGLLGLAWRLYGPGTAAIASVIFVTSPMVWGHGEVAYPYLFLSLSAILVSWCAAESRWGPRNLTLLGALALGAGGGFRPDVLLFLGPTWLMGALRRPIWLAPALGALALVVLAWGIPMVQLSGGWHTYTTILHQ